MQNLSAVQDATNDIWQHDKQSLLILHTKTKVVQHVPMINIKHLTYDSMTFLVPSCCQKHLKFFLLKLQPQVCLVRSSLARSPSTTTTTPEPAVTPTMAGCPVWRDPTSATCSSSHLIYSESTIIIDHCHHHYRSLSTLLSSLSSRTCTTDTGGWGMDWFDAMECCMYQVAG